MKRKMNWSLQWSRDKRFSSVLRYRSPGSVDIYKHYTSSCSPCSLSSTLEALNLSLGCYWYSILACRQSIRGLPTLHTISANYPNQFPHLYIYILQPVSLRVILLYLLSLKERTYFRVFKCHSCVNTFELFTNLLNSDIFLITCNPKYPY